MLYQIGRLQEETTRVQSLETEIGARDAYVRSLETEIGARDAYIRSLEAEIGARDARVRSLETEIAALTRQSEVEKQLRARAAHRAKEARAEAAKTIAKIEQTRGDIPQQTQAEVALEVECPVVVETKKHSRAVVLSGSKT
jgi:chromosome segregation ATPase